MKKTFKIRVQVTKEMELTVDDSELTTEMLEEYSKHFHPVDSADALVQDIAIYYARTEGGFFEGVGKISSWDDRADILIRERDEYAEAEFI